ncbi:MAG: DsbA family protein [Wenzhouxiangellaceae bacterium]|nr:DsbA family protein [Wenzhouxiangellaceae bacterium]
MAAETRTPALLYLADPMCSWCWGFSPVIERLAEDYADRTNLRVVAGGLFPGTEAPMDRHFKASVREHWEHVGERTGQPFDFSFFEREDFVYDTEPACRAAVAARELAPDKVLDMLRELHRAFYRDNRDITDPGIASEVAVEIGLDAGEFRTALESEEIRARTREDFRLARELGMRGFPTLMGYDHQELSLLTEGYAPLERVRANLDRWLVHSAGADSNGPAAMCSGTRRE